MCDLYEGHYLKDHVVPFCLVVHTKVKILTSFTHPHFVANLYEILFFILFFSLYVQNTATFLKISSFVFFCASEMTVNDSFLGEPL